jgi:peptide/nickel transport system ATP-binding protein
VSYVPQNPGTSLNPSLRVASAIEDLIRAHRPDGASAGDGLSWLTKVQLPGTPEFGRRFPHQLSGGQQQRVCIACALACEPQVVVLDEPTTGLDVVTQALILKELVRLRDEFGISMIYVTHDLAVVAQIADRIAVMYAGRIVEQGPADQVLRRPRHPYTLGLLASIPDHLHPCVLKPMPGIAVGVGERPAGCAFAPRCSQKIEACLLEMPSLYEVQADHQARCFEWARTPQLNPTSLRIGEHSPGSGDGAVLEVESLCAEYRSRHEHVVVARDVSFSVARGSCVAMVGESGSGKTTIARTIAGLHPVASGRILLDGVPLQGLARRRSVENRRRVQIVFQNPAEALNPRHTVQRTIARPAQVLRGLGAREADSEVKRLLEAVRLPSRTADRYPQELSGGERQRVSIARALAAEPEVLICDEVTSALDVSVQAAVLALLSDLRDNLGLALIFITHDLGVVALVAGYVLVLEDGVICEEGPPSQVLNAPRQPYTQRLRDAAPSVATAVRAWERAGTSPSELGNVRVPD